VRGNFGLGMDRQNPTRSCAEAAPGCATGHRASLLSLSKDAKPRHEDRAHRELTPLGSAQFALRRPVRNEAERRLAAPRRRPCPYSATLPHDIAWVTHDKSVVRNVAGGLPSPGST